MKTYTYIESVPLALVDMDGESFSLSEGAEVWTDNPPVLRYGYHSFLLPDEEWKHFRRKYSKEEQARYDRIFENALIGAMQSCINYDTMFRLCMTNDEVIPEFAIRTATNLVEALKEKEFLP